ncbi:MAG: lycopene cyclase domain-containing protein [Aggregatilineales bacterium]
MSYFAFLAVFLGIPLAILSGITLIDFKRGKWLPDALYSWKAWVVILGLCIVAFIYTTPWDNYLVATNVWWYDINLVTGIVIGYVPIEEYTFFVVQPIMTGLFTILLMRYLPLNPIKANNARIRIISTVIVAVIWIASVIALILSKTNPDYQEFTYLGLELSWALIPVIIQLAFGADILWRHARIVLPAILISTFYLSAADMLAIAEGTWVIDPAQSLPIYMAGILPIEEFIFFLLTNTLVVLGLTLVLAEESQTRAETLEKYALTRPVGLWLKRINSMNTKTSNRKTHEHLAIPG